MSCVTDAVIMAVFETLFVICTSFFDVVHKMAFLTSETKLDRISMASKKGLDLT